MKKLLNATGTLLLCLLFMPALKAQVRYATLTGKVSAETPFIVLAIPEYYGINMVIDTVKMAKGKTFKHRVKINKPDFVYLNYGDHKTVTLWLKPGDVLSVDLRNNEPLFKGAPAAFAKYDISDHDLWSKIYADYKKRNPGFDEGNNQFTDKYFTIQDSIVKDRLNFLENYFPGAINKNKELTNLQGPSNKDKQAFIKQQTSAFYYMNLYYKLAFSKSDFERFKFYQDRYHISRPYHYALSDKAEFNNMNLLSINFYRKFFCSLVGDMAREKIKQSGKKIDINTYVDLSMSVIDELAAGSPTNIELKAAFLNDFEIDIRMSRNLNEAYKVYAVLSELSAKNTNASLKIVKEKINKIILETKFIAGAKAPDFAFKDVAGKTYGLSDFKGKKIYIDMGASWCGPCIASIPAWNKLVTVNSTNENVIFISLSLDNKETEWKTFLAKTVIKGMNLYAGTGGFKSSFAVNYAIFGIPHFILIDEDGKILQYDAPRPDTDEITQLLQKK